MDAFDGVNSQASWAHASARFLPFPLDHGAELPGLDCHPSTRTPPPPPPHHTTLETAA